MVTAILLAKSNLSVLLIEKQNRGGKKILASGNGKCNIANTNISKSNFYGNNKKLIDSLLKDYSYNDIEQFFKNLGLEFVKKEDNRVFPKSLQAKTLLELLEYYIQKLNITTIYNAKSVEIKESFKISINQNQHFYSNRLIIATGNKAAPQLGGNSSGLEIAKKFGHTIIEPLPALTPLYSSSPICKKSAGVKIEVTLKLLSDNKEITSKKGDLLFTKYGISGLATLDISIEVAQLIRKNQNIKLYIDFFNNYSKRELFEFLKNRVDKQRNLPIDIWLNSIINSNIAKSILDDLNLHKISEKNLNNSHIKDISNLLKSYPIKVDALREFKYAEVAIGGVDSNEVTLNLESKKIKNLYFVGEVLDIIGDRGGYNFIFAWLSAFRVAKAISKKLN